MTTTNRGSGKRAARAARVDRAVSEVAWYTPEVATGVAAAMTAATVWPPMAVVSAGAAGLIAVDRVRIARSNRAAKRKAAAMRAERDGADQTDQTADSADDGTEAPESAGSADGWEVSA